MPFASNDGCRLYWREDGPSDRPALLLLNSIGTDTSIWDRCMPVLMERYRVLRMDCRGHGASDAPTGPYSLELLADDAVAVLEAAQVRSAFVCGISLGGMIAMTLALRRPDVLRGLVLACTSAELDRNAWQQRHDLVLKEGMGSVAPLVLQRFFAESFRTLHPEVVETVRRIVVSTPVPGYAGCCAAIRDMRLFDRLAQITTPTLVIAGSRDISTPYGEHGSRIVAALADAKSHTLEAAHLACVEAPDTFAGAVINFLTEILRGPAEREAGATLYEAGLRNRRAVLGTAWVDEALASRTPFNAEFQSMISRIAWQEVWGRPGLDRRTRRLLVIAITASQGRWEEFRLHVKAGLEQGGFTRDELKEVLLQTAIYAGVPAANTAFSEAKDVMNALDDSIARSS